MRRKSKFLDLDQLGILGVDFRHGAPMAGQPIDGLGETGVLQHFTQASS